MAPNIDPIKTFKEVFDWVLYDLDTPYYLGKDSKGNFYVNKLYIERRDDGDYLTYKCECAKLEEGLFEKVEKLYQLFQE
jgi:hypothetical protein